MITYVVFFNITLPKFMLVYQKKIDSEVYLFLNLKLEYFCEYKLFYTVNRSPMSMISEGNKNSKKSRDTAPFI